jgi:hypothetical protein
VASAIYELLTALVILMGFDASIEQRPPYTQPIATSAMLGDDVVIVSANEVTEDFRAILHAACAYFLYQIRAKEGTGTDIFEFSSLLSAEVIALVKKHVESFRIAWGGKQIPGEFVCRIGEMSVRFSGFFRGKLMPTKGKPETRKVVAQIEGADRTGKRGSCKLLIVADGSVRQAAFVVTGQLLSDIRAALWDGGHYSVSINETTAAGGKIIFELLAIGECVQSGAPLLDEAA